MTGTSNICVIAQNDEECDILIIFMERKGYDVLTFSWPQKKVKHHVPFDHVLCTVPAPTLWKELTVVYT
jgi:hypothetical protein